MTTFNEGRHPGEFLMTEARGQRSRETATIAASQTIRPGTVLAKVSDQYVALDPDADDGAEVAAGIAIYPASTETGETAKVAAIVRDTEANGNCLAWPDGITDAQKADAEQALASLGIIVRN